MSRWLGMLAAAAVALGSPCPVARNESILRRELARGGVGCIALAFGEPITVRAPLVVVGTKTLLGINDNGDDVGAGAALVAAPKLAERLLSLSFGSALNATRVAFQGGGARGGLVAVGPRSLFSAEECSFVSGSAARGGAMLVQAAGLARVKHCTFHGSSAHLPRAGVAVAVRRGGAFISGGGCSFHNVGPFNAPVIGAGAPARAVRVLTASVARRPSNNDNDGDDDDPIAAADLAVGGFAVTLHGSDMFERCPFGFTRRLGSGPSSSTACVRCLDPTDCPLHRGGAPHGASGAAGASPMVAAGASQCARSNRWGDLCRRCAVPSSTAAGVTGVRRGVWGAGGAHCEACGPFPLWRRLVALGCLAALLAAATNGAEALARSIKPAAPEGGNNPSGRGSDSKASDRRGTARMAPPSIHHGGADESRAVPLRASPWWWRAVKRAVEATAALWGSLVGRLGTAWQLLTLGFGPDGGTVGTGLIAFGHLQGKEWCAVARKRCDPAAQSTGRRAKQPHWLFLW